MPRGDGNQPNEASHIAGLVDLSVGGPLAIELDFETHSATEDNEARLGTCWAA